MRDPIFKNHKGVVILISPNMEYNGTRNLKALVQQFYSNNCAKSTANLTGSVIGIIKLHSYELDLDVLYYSSTNLGQCTKLNDAP